LWTIGDRTLLNQPVLALWCSSQCPGDVIVRLYDLARSLRDADIPVIGGFHSPMEKECLDLLLPGTQPIVICPARGIERMRVPAKWRTPLQEGRILVLSPFATKHKRPTVALAWQRNQLVAEAASQVFVAHAASGGKTIQLCQHVLRMGKTVWTLDTASNAELQKLGCRLISVIDFVTMMSANR
jgi:predicted Rossmann fold nucleotide-binding protein DprA/Smf involved in DNA uptake